METVAEYLRHAEISEEMARNADTPEHSAAILRIAKMWRELAAERERMIRIGEMPKRL
jgi:hypothetical protein